MDNEYAFFSFNDDENIGKFFPNSQVYNDFLKYLNTEKELESMLNDNVLDIHVDEHGVFYYYPSKLTQSALPNNIKPKFTTFNTMLERRGLNINRYNRYKKMLRRMTP